MRTIKYMQIPFFGSYIWMVDHTTAFFHFDGERLTRYQLCSVFQICLQFCDIPLHIRSHSFRMGRATEMAKMGIDDEQIKRCGRWNSVSYLRYIRL
jgi:site-specific recombinase XerD